MIRATIVLFIIECFIAKETFATDTLKLNKPISLEKIGREYAPGYLLIDYKIFRIAYTQNNGFFNNLTYPHNKFSQVYFRNCNFSIYESSERIVAPIVNTGFYVIDSCNISFLPMVNISGNVLIASSLLSILSVENTSNLRLSLSNDRSISDIVLMNNRNMKFQLTQCAFKDSGKIRISNTTFSEFNFSYDRRSGCNAFFQNDTINSFIGLLTDGDKGRENYRDWYKHENIFTFSDCHINASFVFFDRIPNSTFIFNNCTFGSNVYLADMAVDKLVIRNCQIFPEQIAIGFREKNSEVKLALVNSNLENIRFDFAPNVKLVFDSIDSKDAIANSYKNLLEKFEHEGKERSYKLVDLQYRSYKDSYICHFLNSIWWYHGYRPELVFIWTAVLLIIFFFFNLKYSTQMIETYPLMNISGHKKLRFYSLVFLYTFFIFFSLRVDLTKLKFKQLRFVYAFLSQYLIGLWCMIFILRFIFKY